MATYRETLRDYCHERGMSLSEAGQVVESFLQSDVCSDYMVSRIDRPVGDLPPQIMAILNLGIKDVALEWIEKNAPQAWYKSMFMDEQP